jgi:hypothetical protein
LLHCVRMASDIHEADVRELIQRHHAHYEVCPYYVLFDERPEGAPPVQRRIQAGFDVDLYGTLEREELPLATGNPRARMVVEYFEAAAREVQERIGQHCTVEVIQFADSLFPDTHEHFRPQAMLRIRISHARGLDQPAGPAEEQAKEAVEAAMREIGAQQGRDSLPF